MSYLSLSNYDKNAGFKIPDEKDLVTILKENTELNAIEIKNILNVRKNNGMQTLTLENEADEDIGYIFEIIGLINKIGYEETYKFLKENNDEVDEKTVLKSTFFDDMKRKYNMETAKMRNKVKISSNGQFTCPRCGSKDTSSVEQQTRAGDEGSTVFITCNGCGHHWKVSN